MKIKKRTLLISLSFFILFAGFFYCFVSPNLWDYDFWWHISTGRYIVETGTIPDKDPFSYTAGLEENKNLFPERENFILKQYWLAQIIFYLIYDYAGPKGIILLRAILFIMVLSLVFLRLKAWNVNFYVSFIFLYLLFDHLMTFTGERPVLFTILFTVVTFTILERFREKKGKGLFLLCPLMLLWSNLHGGFIIGDVMIIIYMMGEGIKIILKKIHYQRQQIILFYTATVSALVFSYINPTGWDAFFIALSPDYKIFYYGIQEYLSPFYLYKNKMSSIKYSYVILMFLFPLILLLRNKRLDLNHVLLLTGLFVMAAKTGRYGVYYASIASMVLGKETNLLLEGLFKRRFSERSYEKIASAFSVAVVISSLLFVIGMFKLEALRFEIAKEYTVPERAVDFIEKNRIPGNLLNEGGYGGYITWRLYPWKKTFIDTRWLNYTVQAELSWIATATESVSHNKKLPEGRMPLWKRLLDHYNINLILIPFLDVYGQVPPLNLKLLDETEWAPVYSDPLSIIFVKNSEENRLIIDRFRLPKEYVYNCIILQTTKLAMSNKISPQSLTGLGDTFYKMGRKKDALVAYQYADKRHPGQQAIKEKIEKVESEIKKDL
ncbi:MAG: hypothetical protein WA126_13890 [Thermodesulfovibrionales bacterium]